MPDTVIFSHLTLIVIKVDLFNLFGACFFLSNFAFTDFMADTMEKILNVTPGLEKGMPRMTPRLEKDMSPNTNSGPSVLLVAGLAVAIITTLLLLFLCVLPIVVIYFRRKRQLIA